MRRSDDALQTAPPRKVVTHDERVADAGMGGNVFPCGQRQRLGGMNVRLIYISPTSCIIARGSDCWRQARQANRAAIRQKRSSPQVRAHGWPGGSHEADVNNGERTIRNGACRAAAAGRLDPASAVEHLPRSWRARRPRCFHRDAAETVRLDSADASLARSNFS